MKKANKLANAYTINFNDDTATLINKLAEYHQRKPAELLRLLITPAIINEYAKMQCAIHPSNTEPAQIAVFKEFTK